MSNLHQKKLLAAKKNCFPLGCGTKKREAMRDIAPSMPSHTGPPEAHLEVLCRRRQRYKNASVLERPPHSYGHRQKLVKGTSPRGLTCHCADKAGYIYFSSLHICRGVLLLLRQRRGAGLGELQRARGQSKYYRIRLHPACFARRQKLES